MEIVVQIEYVEHLKDKIHYIIHNNYNMTTFKE